jgi:glycerol-3-phosphate dehydrogenase
MQVIGGQYQIDLPIARCIYEILWQQKKPSEVFNTIEAILS